MMSRRAKVLAGLLAVVVGAVCFECERRARAKAASVSPEAEPPAAVDTGATPAKTPPAETVQPAPAVTPRPGITGKFETPEEMMARMEAERKAKALQYQDEIDFIRANPDDPDRESVINTILEHCYQGPIAPRDAAYILLEKHKYETSRGEFSWLYVDRAVVQCRISGDYGFAIQCLKDAITALETKDYNFERYGPLRSLNTPEAKAAAIDDLRKRIGELELLKAGGRPSHDLPALPAGYVLPGERVRPSSPTPEQEALFDKATAAIKSGDFDAAIDMYDSVGDRENAAAVMYNKSSRVDLEAGLRVGDEVVARYPGTVQASLAEYWRAQLYKRAERPEDFVRALKKFVAEQPQSHLYGTALGELGLALYAAGETDEAIKYYEQFISETKRRKESISGFVVDMLVVFYQEKGEYDKADRFLAGLIAGLESGEYSMVGDKSDLARVGAVQGLQELRKMNESFQEIDGSRLGRQHK